MNPEQEHTLINGIKEKDELAFKMFFNTFSSDIYNLPYKISGNRDDAFDIAQDVFIQAYLNIDKFRNESKLSTWLYSITKNASYRFLQKKNKHSFSKLEKLINNVKDANAAKNISRIEKDNYIQQVREGCLIGLLRCLSINQRISFILNIILEVDMKEISKILNKSEGTVRVLIHRSKVNIKNFLCKNCSLYKKSNLCKCENLINFSLKQGWIKKPSGRNIKKTSIPNLHQIEKDIKSIEKITILYQTLPKHEVSIQLRKRILTDNLLILNRKKV